LLQHSKPLKVDVNVFKLAISGLVLWISTTVVAAPVLQVDSNGILTGATGVLVNGNLYDVEFRDGTCIALFGGCDGLSDFTFQTELAARAASQALLDSVFVGQFDDQPSLTRGCGFTRSCTVQTPYGFGPFDPISAIVLTAFAFNFELLNGNTDDVFLSSLRATDNLALVAQPTYAVFSPISAVPEPASLLLAATALGLIGFGRRRRKAVVLGE
jgi:hypothetical protein